MRLAAAGNRVLYIENTGVRSPGLRDAGRVALRLKRWAKALRSQGVRQVAPNIYVASPLALPPFGSRWRREINRRIFLPWVQRAARSLGMRDVLVWTYLPSDTTIDLIRLMREPRSAVVYYCVADFTQLTPHVRQLVESEQEVVTESDVVFTNCAELATKFSVWNPNVHVFPFGVNLDAFPLETNGAGRVTKTLSKETRATGDETNAASGVAAGNGHHPALSGSNAAQTNPEQSNLEKLRELPRPIIGYVGGLHRHVDFELLREMALARPRWSWVCVGARQTPVDGVAELPNVFLPGQQPHKELVEYIRLFDVCIVPYVNSIYTTTVVPTKINEYLAVGKPVVSTDLPTVCEFNEEHDVLITAAARPAEFLQGIEEALRLPKDAETVARRREVAALGDWQARLESMSELIQVRLPSDADATK